MPWSSQGGSGGSGGGGGNGGRKGGGPWGQGPWGPSGGGGGKEPPDLDEILRRGQDRVRQVMRGGGGNGSGGSGFGGGVPKPFLFLVAALLLAGAVFYGCFFRVNPDEQRKLRAGLYRPLLGINKSERGQVVDAVMAVLLDGESAEDG